MIRIIKSDLYRVVHGIPLYISLALTALFCLLSVYIMQPGAIGSTTELFDGGVLAESNYSEVVGEFNLNDIQNMSISDLRHTMQKVRGYELDRDILSVNGNLFYFMIFFAALAVTVDFAGSIKNTLSSAISRKRYFVSKALFINLLCIGLLFFNTFLCYFANQIINGADFAASFGKIMKITCMQIPLVMMLASLLCFFAFLCKRTSIYNVATIPLFLILELIIPLIGTLLKCKDTLTNYLPSFMFKRIACNPSGSDLLHIYLFCGILIAVSYLFGWMSFRKTEIK